MLRCKDLQYFCFQIVDLYWVKYTVRKETKMFQIWMSKPVYKTDCIKISILLLNMLH